MKKIDLLFVVLMFSFLPSAMCGRFDDWQDDDYGYECERCGELESEVEELEGKCSDLEEKLEVAREKLEEILNAINE